MSEPWDKCDGEDYRTEYIEDNGYEESDFGEDPFGQYDLDLLFQDEPPKIDPLERMAVNMLKPNPKLWVDRRRK